MVNPIAASAAEPARKLPSLLSGLAYVSLAVGLWAGMRAKPAPIQPSRPETVRTVNLLFDDAQLPAQRGGGGRGGSGAIDPELRRKREDEERLTIENIEKMPTELPREDLSTLGLVDPLLPVVPGGDGLDAGTGGGTGGGSGRGSGQGAGEGSLFRTAAVDGPSMRIKDVSRRYEELPPYPKLAKKMRVEGPVLIRFTVNEEGVPIQVAVVSGHELLREDAIKAAKNWRFEPVVQGGKPVQATFDIVFLFVLQRVG